MLLTTVCTFQQISLNIFEKSKSFGGNEIPTETAERISEVTRLDCARWHIQIGWTHVTIEKSTVDESGEWKKRLVGRTGSMGQSPNYFTTVKFKRRKMKNQTTCEKVARKPVTKLYSSLTTLLDRIRDAAQLAFFEEFEYRFVSLTQLQANMKQDGLQLW